VRRLEDLIAAKQTVVFGSDGGDSAPLTRWPLFMKNVLGANLKVVSGYKGTREINLAMNTGEAGGSCGMFESTVRTSYMNDFNSGDLVIFVQTGFNRNVELFSKATNIYSLLKTEEDIQMTKLVFGPAEITRPFAAPPGVPAARVAALRKALTDLSKDQAMLDESKKIGIDFDPTSGEQTVADFAELFKTPKSIVEKATVMATKP
jgi:hypothetical protein